MPMPLLNAHVAKLPALIAEDSLRAAERVAVGTGSLRKGVGRRITESWQRATEQHRIVIRAQSRDHYRAQMAALGIGVRTVRKADG